MQQQQVKIIKAARVEMNNTTQKQTIRVAAYCRVSTDNSEQLNSFSSQMKYYKEKIQSNSNWTYVDVYSDEAVTGTKVAIRSGFQKMINDCIHGKIDIVITKSISRFARNTVDTLNYVRKLKAQNVAVIFEEENINTLTMDGELLLTILSSVAQQEVQNTSEHVKKGCKMKAQRGELIGCPLCYGYDYNNETKELTINEEEAETVRYIFNRVSQGAGAYVIAKELRNMGILTSKGKTVWSPTTISGIIGNEKYKGDILQGKTYTVDPIEKKRVKNDGHTDQYYMENHHEAIVSKVLWEKANEIVAKRSVKLRKSLKGTHEDFIGKYPLSFKVRCGYCNNAYGRRSHTQTKTEYKNVWKCITATKQGVEYCNQSKAIDEEAIKKAFVESCSILLSTDEALLDKFLISLKGSIKKSNKEPMEKKKSLLEAIKSLEAKKDRLMDLLIDGTITKCRYNEKCLSIDENIKKANDSLENIDLTAHKQDSIEESILRFKDTLITNPVITEFDNDVFEALIDKIIIGGYDDGGKSVPNLVTIVFDLVPNINTSVNAKYCNIGSFDCKYIYHEFISKSNGSRKKISMNSFPVKIMIKIE